jgi:hypothetical protein
VNQIRFIDRYKGFFCFVVLGLELRALHLEPLQQPCFVVGLFEIGSCELFSLAGIEL